MAGRIEQQTVNKKNMIFCPKAGFLPSGPNKKIHLTDGLFFLSGRLDSNQRPPAPHADTLPDCATPRTGRKYNKTNR